MGTSHRSDETAAAYACNHNALTFHARETSLAVALGTSCAAAGDMASFNLCGFASADAHAQSCQSCSSGGVVRLCSYRSSLRRTVHDQVAAGVQPKSKTSL